MKLKGLGKIRFRPNRARLKCQAWRSSLYATHDLSERNISFAYLFFDDYIVVVLDHGKRENVLYDQLIAEVRRVTCYARSK